MIEGEGRMFRGKVEKGWRGDKSSPEPPSSSLAVLLVLQLTPVHP